MLGITERITAGTGVVYSFKYANGTLDINPQYRMERGREVRYMPADGSVAEVLKALKKKFGDQPLRGTLDGKGNVTIKFDAFKEAA